MSRNIVNDHLWTDEEVRYQLSRGRREFVEQNRVQFGPGGELEGQDLSVPEPEDNVLELDQDIYDYVTKLDVEGAQEALRQRKIQPKGNEAQLKTALAQSLQSERDAQSR